MYSVWVTSQPTLTSRSFHTKPVSHYVLSVLTLSPYRSPSMQYPPLKPFPPSGHSETLGVTPSRVGAAWRWDFCGYCSWGTTPLTPPWRNAAEFKDDCQPSGHLCTLVPIKAQKFGGQPQLILMAIHHTFTNFLFLRNNLPRLWKTKKLMSPTHW